MAFSPLISAARRLRAASARSAVVFLQDVGHGLLEVSHNTLALIGLMMAAVLMFAATRADIRHEAESWTLGWLQARQEAREQPTEPADVLAAELSEPDAIARATASDPNELRRQQAAVVKWLSHRYRVAPEPVSRLVQEALSHSSAVQAKKAVYEAARAKSMTAWLPAASCTRSWWPRSSASPACTA